MFPSEAIHMGWQNFFHSFQHLALSCDAKPNVAESYRQTIAPLPWNSRQLR